MTPPEAPPPAASAVSAASGLRGPRLLAAALVVFLGLTTAVTWPWAMRAHSKLSMAA